MPGEISNSDWKHFRAIREVALQRLCERILNEIGDIVADESKTSYERYVAAFKSINDGDEKVADAFNNLSRSRMTMQLAFMNAQGLLEETEIAKFTDRIQEQLKSFTKF